MAFAQINSDLSYWKKQTTALYPDLTWNIPEQKTGKVAVIGGNSQNFSTPIRIAEFLNQNFPIKHLTTILPDALRGKLPLVANIDFTPSTNSGSFANSRQLELLTAASDAALLIGDLSKNSATAVAIANVVNEFFSAPDIMKPFIITRDSVDLLTSEASNWLTHPSLILIASMAQLQKVFQSVYYPRMILLSQPLIPIIETLHKFTITYPLTILTFHQDNIIVANGGNIVTTHIVDTDYSPISLWSGQLAAKVLALNLYNPKKYLAATTAAILT